MHVNEVFLAQKHTDGRRCRHLRAVHTDVTRAGELSVRTIDYDVRIAAPEEASLRVQALGFRV